MSDQHPATEWRHRAFEALRGSTPSDAQRFAQLMRHPRYPHASAYDPSWVQTNHMRPNVLWLTEALSQLLDLRPGMRVLDMGCGTALSSIFLARGCGVEVWAVDLWIPPHDNLARIREAGLMEQVYALHAEGRAYPFQEHFFDLALSVDSYHYWGCDPRQLDYVARFVRPGGYIAILVPGDANDSHPVGTFHSAMWWRELWERCRQVCVEHAETLDNGWSLWWQFCEASAAWSGQPVMQVPDAEMLTSTPSLGFSGVVACREAVE